jgi:hypothetical protein
VFKPVSKEAETSTIFGFYSYQCTTEQFCQPNIQKSIYESVFQFSIFLENFNVETFYDTD